MKDNLIAPTGVIWLSDGMMLTIGSSFQSDIFFRNGSSSLALLGVLVSHGTELEFTNEETGERSTLLYGDEIRINGLFLKFLGKILIVCAYEGDYRISVRKGRGNASFTRG